MTAITLKKRKPKRSPALLPVEFDAGECQTQGRIRNLSSSGALIEADDVARPDADVVLTCGELTLTGRVAWVDDTRFGVEFDVPVTADVVSELRGGSLVVSAPRSFRPSRLELEEDAAARSSRAT